jgi:NADH/NAD ratio-sensing transcriptional regulator Rex
MIKIAIIGANELGFAIHNQLLVVNYIEPSLYDIKPTKFSYGVSMVNFDDENDLSYLIKRKDVIISAIQNNKIETECIKYQKIYIDGVVNKNITPEEILIHIKNRFYVR